jgi:hypothetical protein
LVSAPSKWKLKNGEQRPARLSLYHRRLIPAASVAATLSREANTQSHKTASPPATPTSHPKDTPRTGLCQQRLEGFLGQSAQDRLIRDKPFADGLLMAAGAFILAGAPEEIRIPDP